MNGIPETLFTGSLKCINRYGWQAHKLEGLVSDDQDGSVVVGRMEDSEKVPCHVGPWIL